jgi:Flp pilus assembly protein TadD
LARGDQYWRLKQHDKAQAEFEKAVAANNEQLPMARWKLAEAYIRGGNGQAGLDLLAPLEEKFPQQYEVVAGIGFSHYLLGNFEIAADYLARAMQIRPADTTLLNALGDSFIKIGDSEKAKEALERSLAMDPNQKVTKDLLASIETQD